MDQKIFKTLINEALQNPDPDIQYMRAEEITNELTIYYGKPEQNDKNQKIINECYIRDLKKCNQIVLKIISINEILRSQYITKELLKSSTQSMIDTRENYHICLLEIVEKITCIVQFFNENQEEIIKKLRELKEAIKKLQVSNQIVHQEIQQNIEIQAELLKILSLIMSRWPKLYLKDFSDLLLDNIINSNELSIRKN